MKERFLNPALFLRNIGVQSLLGRSWRGGTQTTPEHLTKVFKRGGAWAESVTPNDVKASIRTLGCFHLERGVVAPTKVTKIDSPRHTARCESCKARKLLGDCPMPTSVVPARNRSPGQNVFTRGIRVELKHRFLQPEKRNWMNSLGDITTHDDPETIAGRAVVSLINNNRRSAERDFRWNTRQTRTK